MRTPTVTPMQTTTVRITRPVPQAPTIDKPTIAWEREIYDNDPCGGAATRY